MQWWQWHVVLALGLSGSTLAALVVDGRTGAKCHSWMGASCLHLLEKLSAQWLRTNLSSVITNQRGLFL